MIHPKGFPDRSTTDLNHADSNDIATEKSLLSSLMATPLLTAQSESETEIIEGDHTFLASDVEENWGHVGGPRFTEFMKAVKRMARLQRQTVKAQIDARQKRRQAGFKRRDVSIRDANFMKELQKLVAQGKLKDFEELQDRAGQCQMARDELGPLEEEGTEAEQRLEGETWKLRLAQDYMLDEFREEFQSAENYPSGPSSRISSQYESGSDSATQILDSTEAIALTGVHEQDISGWEDRGEERDGDWDSDSGIGDLDRRSNIRTTNSMGEPVFPPRLFQHAIYERYPSLSADFGTKRDVINNWLLSTVLLSRLEATIIKNQLDAEDSSSPSNWAQLVIAYWEKDAAPTPYSDSLNSRDGKFKKVRTRHSNRTVSAENCPRTGPTIPEATQDTAYSPDNYKTNISGGCSKGQHSDLDPAGIGTILTEPLNEAGSRDISSRVAFQTGSFESFFPPQLATAAHRRHSTPDIS